MNPVAAASSAAPAGSLARARAALVQGVRARQAMTAQRCVGGVGGAAPVVAMGGSAAVGAGGDGGGLVGNLDVFRALSAAAAAVQAERAQQQQPLQPLQPLQLQQQTGQHQHDLELSLLQLQQQAKDQQHNLQLPPLQLQQQHNPPLPPLQQTGAQQQGVQGPQQLLQPSSATYQAQWFVPDGTFAGFSCNLPPPFEPHPSDFKMRLFSCKVCRIQPKHTTCLLQLYTMHTLASCCREPRLLLWYMMWNYSTWLHPLCLQYVAP